MLKILLFIISYIPLYIILYFNEVAQQYAKIKNSKIKLNQRICDAFLSTGNDRLFCVILLILIFVPIIVFMLVLYYKLHKNLGSSEVPPRTKTTNDTIVSYLMTYVIPFTSIGLNSNPISVLSSGLLFLTVLILFVRLNVVYLNPPLILIGFNIFSDVTDERKYLTKNSMAELRTAHINGELVKITRLTDDFFYISKYNP